MPNIILKVPVDFQFGSGGLPHKPGKHYISEELFNQWFVPGLIRKGDLIVDEGGIDFTEIKELKYEVTYPDHSGKIREIPTDQQMAILAEAAKTEEFAVQGIVELKATKDITSEETLGTDDPGEKLAEDIKPVVVTVDDKPVRRKRV